MLALPSPTWGARFLQARKVGGCVGVLSCDAAEAAIERDREDGGGGGGGRRRARARAPGRSRLSQVKALNDPARHGLDLSGPTLLFPRFAGCLEVTLDS